MRVAKWLRAIWRGRGNVDPDGWRLYFVVMLEGRPVGEQTLTGVHFSTLGTVTTFSWLSVDERGRGLGHELRANEKWAPNHGLLDEQIEEYALITGHPCIVPADVDASWRPSSGLSMRPSGGRDAGRTAQLSPR